MTEITNADRAAWAATAIQAFTAECRMDGEDAQTKAKDLVTNLVHYLRLECGLSLEQASNVVNNAVNMAEQETAEDSDGDDDADQPIEREYGVRLWATLRGEYEYTVSATSLKDAISKVKEADHFYITYKLDSVDGDQTAHVFGPDDDDPNDEDTWGGDGVEIDMRQPGEPFSWDACAIVKDLAKLDGVIMEGHPAILSLISRAKDACTKEN